MAGPRGCWPKWVISISSELKKEFSCMALAPIIDIGSDPKRFARSVACSAHSFPTEAPQL
jgi:hypothetical protein